MVLHAERHLQFVSLASCENARLVFLARVAAGAVEKYLGPAARLPLGVSFALTTQLYSDIYTRLRRHWPTMTVCLAEAHVFTDLDYLNHYPYSQWMYHTRVKTLSLRLSFSQVLI